MEVNKAQGTQAYSQPKKVAKAIAGTVATAAVMTAGLALGAKHGKFTVTEETSAVAKKILPYLDKAGKFINNKASQVAKTVVESQAYKTVVAKANESGVTGAIKEGFKKGQGVADDISSKVKQADIKGKAKGIADNLTEKVKKADIKGKAQAGIKKGQSLIETLVAKAKGLFNKETAKKVVDAVVE